jgi:hypothetical protein
MLVAVGLTAPAIADAFAPQLFKITSHDFGSVARGAKAEFRFEIENIFIPDVHIESARSSCSCTSVRIEKQQLKTYEKSAIVATFNTGAFRGQRGATITVTFNQPRRESVQLHVKGYIQDVVNLQPNGVEFGEVELGTGAKRTITVSRTGRPDWQIVDVRCANPHLAAKVTGRRQDFGRVTYTLEVELIGQAPEGVLRDHIILVTNDSLHPEMPVQVDGRVCLPVVVNPGELFVGVVKPGQKVTRSLIARSKRPFRVISISSEAKKNSFEFRPVNNQPARPVHAIPVTFVAPQKPGKIVEKILLQTDLGGEPIEVPVYGVVR